ncbi:hypothetical protein HKX48_006045 [Thoreauomyces humboldtii]|nr:hypothetical protein HKX48_006045 [Thoreauomyces humboldtii]
METQVHQESELAPDHHHAAVAGNLDDPAVLNDNTHRNSLTSLSNNDHHHDHLNNTYANFNAQRMDDVSRNSEDDVKRTYFHGHTNIYRTNTGTEVVHAPHMPKLAFLIALIFTIFFGPFGWCLLCFYTTSRTRRAVFMAMTIANCLQGTACFIAGKVVTDNCRKAANNSDGQDGQACANGYGFQHKTDATFDNQCATSCSTIWRTCAIAGVIFFILAGLSLIGSIFSQIHVRSQRKRHPESNI